VNKANLKLTEKYKAEWQKMERNSRENFSPEEYSTQRVI
jgi:hypothetical protein